MGKYMPSNRLEMGNSRTPDLKFSKFFKQSSMKITGKATIWIIVCFSPLPPLSNLEEQ